MTCEFARTVAGKIVAAADGDVAAATNCAPLIAAVVGADAAAKAAAADKVSDAALAAALGL